jgi:hypothetical protein
MGGGRRKDTPDNIAILCRECHMDYDLKGQSPENQTVMREHVMANRTEFINNKILSFLREQMRVDSQS